MIRVFISILMYLIGWICEGHAQELPNRSAEMKSISANHDFMNNHNKMCSETHFNTYFVHAENESFNDRVNSNAIIEKDL